MEKILWISSILTLKTRYRNSQDCESVIIARRIFLAEGRRIFGKIQNCIGEKIFPSESKLRDSPKCVSKFQKIVQFFQRCSSKDVKEGSSVPRAKNFVGNVVSREFGRRGWWWWHFETSVRPGEGGGNCALHLHCTNHRNHPLHGSFPQPLAATISALILTRRKTGERVTCVPTSTRDCIVFTLDQSCPIFFIPLVTHFRYFRLKKTLLNSLFAGL